MSNHIFTDLACEIYQEKENPGYEWQEDTVSPNLCIRRLTIHDTEGEKQIGEVQGTYVTFFAAPLWQLPSDAFSELSHRIAAELKQMMWVRLAQISKRNTISVLVVGVGNPLISSDAIGPRTAEQVTVTGHIFRTMPEKGDDSIRCLVYAMIPDVLGNTGIETVELVRGAVRAVSPDLVIAVDALAAGDCERLASTIQLSDVGIFPGSGLGNRRKAIRADTLGVPVLALGIPTVVNSSTLITETLRRGGITAIPQEIQVLLKNKTNYFVAPKEIDLLLRSGSLLLASAIDEACTFR